MSRSLRDGKENRGRTRKDGSWIRSQEEGWKNEDKREKKEKVCRASKGRKERKKVSGRRDLILKKLDRDV